MVSQLASSAPPAARAAATSNAFSFMAPPLDQRLGCTLDKGPMARRAQLYLITPPAFELETFSRLLAETLADGHVSAVQLRMKDASDADVLHAGVALKPIVQNAAAALIINDRPDLAARIDADGVHVGQSDASYAQARALVGRDKIVGVTRS